ncbi:MAG: DUF3575 domain-containing protein [Bacteroidales bacterium]
MLFDLATALNIELEIPIGNQFSIAGQWLFPFWKYPDSDFTFNLLYGQVDFKYWMGNRNHQQIMSGWFCDLYGGYGKYDLQPFSKKGVQGHVLNISMGTGYAHPIGKNLRMEYSVGVGYIRSDYNKYDMAYDTIYDDIKVVRYPWKKFYINLPSLTRLSVSLVWLINGKKTQ